MFKNTTKIFKIVFFDEFYEKVSQKLTANEIRKNVNYKVKICFYAVVVLVLLIALRDVFDFKK